MLKYLLGCAYIIGDSRDDKAADLKVPGLRPDVEMTMQIDHFTTWFLTPVFSRSLNLADVML